MEIKSYVNMILKRKWLIILLPLVSALVSAFVSFFLIKPVYESSTTLYILDQGTVLSKSLSYNDIMTGNMLVKDYRELMKSRTVTEAVIEHLGLKEIKPSELAKNISIIQKKDTRILEIIVYAGSPDNAKQIADTVVSVFTQKAAEIMKIDMINVIDTASIPESPSAPKPVLNICLALITGLIVAGSCAMILEFMDDTIKSSQDVEKYLGVSVMGAIPILTIE